jgi:hypothetical protein
MPRNTAIQALLATKTHLLVNNDLPETYIQFLDHYNSWQVTHERWKKEGVTYSWHSKVNWPDAFEDEVLSTFRALMKHNAELIDKATSAEGLLSGPSSTV